MSFEGEEVDSNREPEYAPRPGDELIEPLFGALGNAEKSESTDSPPSPRAAPWWRRLLRRVLPAKDE